MPTFGRRSHRIIIKTRLALIIYLSLLSSRIVSQIPPKIILITPALASGVKVAPTGQIEPTAGLLPPVSIPYFSGQRYSQTEIDQMLEGTQNPGFLRKIIKCESQNSNVARMDSNGLISFGILQFNGTATWNTFAPRAGVPSSNPMNPTSAIKVADWMITHGEIHRWTCARIVGIIN